MEIKLSYLKCNNCDRVLRRGIRRFGPVKIECKECKNIMDTNLNDWAQLSIFKRLFFILLELIYPSFFRGSTFIWIVFMWPVHFAGFWLFLLLPMMFFSSPNSKLEDFLPAFIMLGIYFVLFMKWLIRMILECIKYSKNKIPIIW